MRYYIRFGDLPAAGRSEHQNWPEPWHAAAAEQAADTAVDADDNADWQAVYDLTLESYRLEPGVSCYAAVADGSGYRLVGSAASLEYAAQLMSERPAYLLAGTEIDECGTDGEPCLADVTVLRQLRADEVIL